MVFCWKSDIILGMDSERRPNVRVVLNAKPEVWEAHQLLAMRHGINPTDEYAEMVSRAFWID